MADINELRAQIDRLNMTNIAYQEIVRETQLKIKTNEKKIAKLTEKMNLEICKSEVKEDPVNFEKCLQWLKTSIEDNDKFAARVLHRLIAGFM